MMRLTRAAEYAIRCVLYLTIQGRGVVVKRRKIATEADIPSHFLAKIAQQLAKAGLIEIRQGPLGGLALLKDSKSITLLTVVETMIGKIFLNDCVELPGSCKVYYNCSVHKIWIRARDQLRETLAAVTFDQLAQDGPCVPILPALSAEGGN
jgi:Rrf2 family protein